LIWGSSSPPFAPNSSVTHRLKDLRRCALAGAPDVVVSTCPVVVVLGAAALSWPGLALPCSRRVPPWPPWPRSSARFTCKCSIASPFSLSSSPPSSSLSCGCSSSWRDHAVLLLWLYCTLLMCLMLLCVCCCACCYCDVLAAANALLALFYAMLLLSSLWIMLVYLPSMLL
jgi:hypothetical protein